MSKEVEILKIGSVMPVLPIKRTRVYDTSQFRDKQTIMIISDGDHLFDYYINILRNNCDDYNYLKTTKSIVGKPHTFKFDDTFKGISDKDPVVGKSFTINNSSWFTSTVEKIIDGCILITKNSVYAIHNISDVRQKKLDDLVA